jgi:hypothetical protein
MEADNATELIPIFSFAMNFHAQSIVYGTTSAHGVNATKIVTADLSIEAVRFTNKQNMEVSHVTVNPRKHECVTKILVQSIACGTHGVLLAIVPKNVVEEPEQK